MTKLDRPVSFIIEDDKNLSVAFAEAMKSASYEAVIIRNGSEALERLKKEIPSTIVLDLHLPGASGEVILDHLRSRSIFDSVKVIVVTADKGKAEALPVSADIILVKPIGLQQLRDIAVRLHPQTVRI